MPLQPQFGVDLISFSAKQCTPLLVCGLDCQTLVKLFGFRHLFHRFFPFVTLVIIMSIPKFVTLFDWVFLWSASRFLFSLGYTINSHILACYVFQLCF